MLRSKSLKIACAFLLALSLSACGSVVLHDQEVCGDMGDIGAICFHTLSDQERDIPKPDWDSERFGQLCMKPEAYAEFKAAILKLCRVSRRCTYQDLEALRRFGVNLTEFEIKTGLLPGLPSEYP